MSLRESTAFPGARLGLHPAERRTLRRAAFSPPDQAQSDPGVVFAVRLLAVFAAFCSFLLPAIGGFASGRALAQAAAAPMVSAGYSFVLALKSDGTMTAWGRNESGQLGNGQAALRVSPARVAGIDQVNAVAAGSAFSLALRTDGTLWGWGLNDSGQLGDGSSQSRSYPVRVTGISGTVASIAAGNWHSLASTTDGNVWAWGFNERGQLGIGGVGESHSAIRVSGLPGVRRVAAGAAYSLVLATDGTVWSWGENIYGQLGDGTTDDRATPARIAALSNIVAISAYAWNGLALDASGRVWSWGYGGWGQLGDGTTGNRSTPFVVPGLPGIRAVRAGNLISVAIADDGSVWMWGSNDAGQFGDTQTTRQPSPTRVSVLTGLGLADFTVGEGYVLAPSSAGTVWSWGLNDRGQLGLGDTNDRAVPTLVSGLPQTTQLAGGLTHGTALASDGSVWAWGTNGSGELGDSLIAASSVPVNVLAPGNMVAVAAGSFHNLALRADGSVWAWGGNNNGELGNGTNRGSLLPQEVPGLSAVRNIAAGYEFSLALDSNGRVWSWGLQSEGQLGNGSLTGAQLIPQMLTTISNDVTTLASGVQHVLAVRSDGSVLSWGRNNNGQLGDGTTTNSGTPKPVTGLSNVAAVSAGFYHSLALDRGGAVWAWGQNDFGQIGDGTYAGRLTPVRVSGLDDVVAISAGQYSSCAITRDGRLWTWGDNRLGQTGTGSTAPTVPVATPVQGIAGFQSLGCGVGSVVAMRTDGTVWGWGRNFEGQIGDGTFANRSLPVLAVNETVSGPLDLNLQVTNSIPQDRIPPFLVATSRAGDLSRFSLSVDVKGITGAGTFAAATDSGRFAAAYNVYVAAIVPSGGTPLYFQLDSGNSWSALRWPMAEFMRGVAQNIQDVVVTAQILQDVDLSQLAGAEILVGYGTDPDEMAGSSRFRTIFTVPQQ